jgi:hypothetical protein
MSQKQKDEKQQQNNRWWNDNDKKNKHKKNKKIILNIYSSPQKIKTFSKMSKLIFIFWFIISIHTFQFDITIDHKVISAKVVQSLMFSRWILFIY